MSSPNSGRSSDGNIPDHEPAVCVAGDETGVWVGEADAVDGAGVAAEDVDWLGWWAVSLGL